MPEIEVSELAYDYLQSLAVPFEDTPMSVLDRLVAQHREFTQSGALSAQTREESAGMSLEFNLHELPNVAFTSVTAATVAGKPARHYWNDVLSDVIEAAVIGGATVEMLRKLLSVQLREGLHEDGGYRSVPKTNVSFQGVDANRACRAIASIAEEYSIQVSLRFVWQHNPKAQFAGKAATLELP